MGNALTPNLPCADDFADDFADGAAATSNISAFEPRHMEQPAGPAPSALAVPADDFDSDSDDM